MEEKNGHKKNLEIIFNNCKLTVDRKMSNFFPLKQIKHASIVETEEEITITFRSEEDLKKIYTKN
jgi:hypothetical protein